jgi:hypothetical protein
MFNLSYISNDDKQLLAKLQDRLSHAKDAHLRNETEIDINNILNKAKPYTECTLEEAQELSNQLTDQKMRLFSLGKLAAAQAFDMHIKDVEFHIQTLRLKAALETRRIAPDVPPNSRNKPTSLNDLEKQKKKITWGRARYMVDMDEEDDE